MKTIFRRQDKLIMLFGQLFLVNFPRLTNYDEKNAMGFLFTGFAIYGFGAAGTKSTKTEK